MNTIKKPLILSILLIFFFESEATHIKGGQIHYKQVSGRTFEITFIGYRSINGILFQNGTVDFGDGMTFGGEDGNEIPWERLEPENGAEQWRFTLTHTYANPGTYLVGYTEEFRSDGIQNILGSINTTFYTEAQLAIDPLFGPNSSPEFEVKDFLGVVGQPYSTSFSTTDPDGDSLSYHLTTPLQSAGMAVDYLVPNHFTFYDGNQGSLQLSSTTGNLIWETENLDIPPLESREFNIAVKIVQWRDHVMIGENTIDYTVELWNLNTTGFEPVIFEAPVCFDQNSPDVIHEIEFQNPSAAELVITFSSGDAFLVNDKTPERWNEEMSDSLITSKNFIIEVSFSADEFEESIGILKMNLVADILNTSGVPLTISQSSAVAYYGISCDPDVLSTDQLDHPVLKIEREGISFSPTNNYTWAMISDLSGKVILESDLTRTKTIHFNFERDAVYLITLVSGERSERFKFLIK